MYFTSLFHSIIINKVTFAKKRRVTSLGSGKQEVPFAGGKNKKEYQEEKKEVC